MSADEPTPEEAQFAALFAAGEEILASGRPAAAACPPGTPPELEARLQRDLACVQLLHRALRRPAAEGPPAVLTLPGTVDLPAQPPGRIKLALAPGATPETASEIRTLLQRRLRLASVCALSAHAYFTVTSLLTIGRNPREFLEYWSYYPPTWLSFLGTLGLALVLWRRPSLSVRKLRGIELLLFGLALTDWTRMLFCHLVLDDQLLEIHNLGRSPEEAVGLVFLYAAACSVPYILLIVGYATLIPSGWRRCTAVVSVMAATPIAMLVAAAPRMVPILPTYLVYMVLPMGIFLALAVAFAAYGTHRIEMLRREAVEARKLGQYRLKQRLGAGGMGEVYLAEHVLLKQPCAVKLIRPERAGDTAVLRRFEREVQATARLKHWNTVQIYDYGHAADGTFYYVMEYLPGPTLEGLVTRHGPLPPARAVHLLRQACAALREAHAGGLIHRDIKPANMMVCERGGVHDVLKLLDFGLVKAVGLDNREETLTQQGAIAGTPAYMSPEQASGQEDLDARTDVYSLGAVAYFLLTGQPPFRRDRAIQLLVAHIHEPVRPLTDLAEVPADLQEVVLRCLEKEPGRRFPDTTGLQEALAACGCAGRWTEDLAARWWQTQGLTGTAPEGAQAVRQAPPGGPVCPADALIH